MVKFNALQSVKVLNSKIPKHQGDVLDDVLEDRILDELRLDAKVNQKELAAKLQTSLPSVQRAMNRLKESERIVRVGGKRYGHWQIND